MGGHSSTSEGIVDGSMIARVRSFLHDDENNRVDDAMVERYIRAVNFKDERKAARRIQHTLQWYDKEGPPEDLYCPVCYGRDDAQHYMHVCAYDKVGRPTIYSCLELALNKNVEDNRKHIISTFESAIAVMGKDVISWNWVLDLHGFRLVDCDPRLAKIFLNLAADHYVERLGHFFLIDAPRLFSSLWSAISNFIDPKTKKKIQFLSLKKEESLREALLEHFDEDTVDWFIVEMKDNRMKKRDEKTYNYGAFSRALQIEYRRKNNDSNGVTEEKEDAPHNHLFAPRFLDGIIHHCDGVIPGRMMKQT